MDLQDTRRDTWGWFVKIEDISRQASEAQIVGGTGFSDYQTFRPAAVGLPGAGDAIYRHGLKRAVDLALTFMALPLLLPIILGLAILVMLDGHSPFYAQKRLGTGGRVYRMWKLRSMVPNADARLKDILARDPAARAEWEHTQKLRNDPRITTVGRVLRRFSLDELPQFFNVVTGDMSLVGPRPMMLEQAALYPGWAYYALRPGLTGPWQVSARNESSFADRAQYDDAYIRDLSFGTDLKLVARTAVVMLRGTGH